MDAWSQIKASLRSSMSAESYRSWLEPVSCSRLDKDRRLHLVAPNDDVGDRLESEFLPSILSTARTLEFDITEVQVSIAEPEPPLAQQPLDLGPGRPDFNSRYTFERFVVGSCNEFAHAASRAVASRPAESYNPLYMYSDVGLGKTHLLHAIGHQLRTLHPDMTTVYISAEEFMNEMIKSIKFNDMRRFHQRFRKADALLVDDIQVIGSKERTQEEFFHTFNALHNRGKQIVICSDSDPEDIPGLVGRLKSRFSWGLMADIQPPDLETKMAILDRKSEEAGVQLPADARSYIATRLNTNIRELEGVLNRLIARAQFVGCKISLAMVRSMFGSLSPRTAAGPSISSIQQAVALEFQLQVEDLTARNNAAVVVQPRQVAMYLAKHLTSASLSEIGRAFRRHHTTVLHSIEKIEREILEDPEFKDKIKSLVDQLKSSINSQYI